MTMMKFLSEEELNQQFDREDYLQFLDDDLRSKEYWYGVSIQRYTKVTGDENVEAKIEMCEEVAKIFSALIADIPALTQWTINHDDKFMPWFKSGMPVLHFPNLAHILKDQNVGLNAVGALMGSTNDITTLAKEIVMYPTVLMYKDLDCCNVDDGMIIKSTGHICVDLITKDSTLLREYLNKIDGVFDVSMVSYNHNQ